MTVVFPLLHILLRKENGSMHGRECTCLVIDGKVRGRHNYCLFLSLLLVSWALWGKSVSDSYHLFIKLKETLLIQVYSLLWQYNPEVRQRNLPIPQYIWKVPPVRHVAGPQGLNAQPEHGHLHKKNIKQKKSTSSTKHVITCRQCSSPYKVSKL